MGSLYEFNWILKLATIDIDSMSIDSEHHFVKNGIRIYPIDTPIDLVNGNWEAVARCVIKKITLSLDSTEGEYKILEIYDKEKKSILSEQWRSLLRRSMGEEYINDYSKKHIT